ncbi:kinase-like protein [Rickenella mellea]|uniref:non-specific serine/threonine protein kinase n=1 Tax=Rickenella mellea TaxID=50990 RepID=A0A4R5XFK7_9AGAM|nr:kinase-like protein [Rickenella mellea]
MAEPILISRHSSNPLEVESSDPQNIRYLRQYKKAQEMRGEIQSSDDPLGGYRVHEIEAYQAHVARVVNKPDPLPVNANEQHVDEYSDDELIITDTEEELRMDPPEDDPAVGDELPDDGMETDEEKTILLKPAQEREEIEDEITDLEEAVPELCSDYKIVDRLGTGTFSSVYKAVDLHPSKWHDRAWQGNRPQQSDESSSQVGKVFVAIKRIYVTSSPERVKNEIAILQDCRGCRHVSQLITAFRHRDQVVAIMPYHRNEDFRDFFRTSSMDCIKAYFRCLLRALRDIHARQIIHRDVKPANFLFDPRTNNGTLCDFGLACRMVYKKSEFKHDDKSRGRCLHTAPDLEHPHGRLRARESLNVEHIKSMQREARLKSAMPSDKVGYLANDKRAPSKANRAGTRGFRAPEVLLKCNEQSGAIDIWAVGTILLFFLTGKFPLFQSNDDIEALMEIAAIIGKRRMEKAATLHNRTFATNVPSVTADGMSWREFVEKQNPDISIPPTSEPVDASSSQETNAEYTQDVELAFDLLEQLMQPECTKRITARGALYHPFLADTSTSQEDGVEGDDAHFPHPVGGGVCGHLHFRDPVTEEHTVAGLGPGGEDVKNLSAGEGIPIGSRPCEYHSRSFQV